MGAWLVTGAGGFLGRHVLTAVATETGAEVVALGRRCPPGWRPGAFVAADLEDPRATASALQSVRPAFVIHAAGRTPPGPPSDFYRANTLATLHLIDALKSVGGPPARLVVVGSAAEFGPVPECDLPVVDDHPCHPVHPYGLSKWLATCATVAAASPVLEAVVARVFNPVGPGQPTGQVFARFAASLLEAAAGPLTVGGLDARRDFVDVRDVARALVSLALSGRPATLYNVGTGQSHRVGDGLTHLMRRSGRHVPLRVEANGPGAAGPVDSRAAIGRIRDHTGWRPVVSFERSLDDLWDATVAARGCH